MSARRRTAGIGRFAAFALWLAPGLAASALALSNLAGVDRLRNLVFDEYQAMSPRAWSPDLPVRIIDIDDASLDKLGQWPWPRNRLAELTTKLNELGAAAIAFDIVFAEPDRSSPDRVVETLPDSPERRALAATLSAEQGHDAQFRDAIAAAPVVLAAALSEGGAPTPPPVRTGFAHAGDDPRRFAPAFPRAVSPLPLLAEAAKGVGVINFTPGRDLVLRSVPLVAAFTPGSRDGATLAPSLSAEALRVAQGASTIVLKSSNASGEEAFGLGTGIVGARIGAAEIATERDGSVRIRYAGQQKGRYIPAWKMLAGEVSREEIEGRIVFIGTSAAGLLDLRPTPLAGAVPGVDVHAELIEHVASGSRLARPDYAPGLEAALALLCAGLAGTLARRLRPVGSALATLLIVASVGGGSFALFQHADLLIDALPATVGAALAYASVTVAVYRRSERERRTVRDAFSRYLAPAFVERIADDPAQVKLGGEVREVTVLFCDARNFTARSETLDAQGVVDFLNRLHTPLTAIVLDEGGTIDKYIGDGLMAFWNAPIDLADHAERACRAAQRMQAAIPAIDEAMRLDAERAGRPHIPLRIGIGVNTGEVFVGNMGSEQRFDYSIVGDAVNVAARLESATKELGAPIAVSAATMERAPRIGFTRIGAVELRGKSARVEAFTPTS